MRLVSLTSNKSTFKSVRFNPTGLSLIVGSPSTSKAKTMRRTDTTNGVGKTLLIAIINYCLASAKIPAFSRLLKDWTFTLEVLASDGPHVITRSASDPDSILFDNAATKLSRLRDWLEKACCPEAASVAHISFRSILSQFLRLGRSAYARFDQPGQEDTKKPYQPMLRAAYLLGLDLGLAGAKYKLRARTTQLKATMKQIEDDPLFADILVDETAEIELAALREEEQRMDIALRGFRVAEDYQEIQDTADTTKRELEMARRSLVKVEDAIAQANRSLTLRADLSVERVRAIYEEAKIALPELVVRRIEEVLAFQRKVLERRAFRLTGELQQLEGIRAQLEGTVAELGKQLDQQLGYLGTHVALDEFLAVNARLAETRQKISRLEAAAAQREKVRQEQRTLAASLAQESVKADRYLVQAKALIQEADAQFRSHTRALYGTRPSGMTVRNDDGENTTRYVIDTHIASDVAEGINEAKIFCYDLMLARLQRRHAFRFLVHDSSLYHPIDHRQRLSALDLAHRIGLAEERQYIATLNEDDVAAIVPHSDEERASHARVFDPRNVVLRLSDRTPAEKLLGVEIDMDYLARESASEEGG